MSSRWPPVLSQRGDESIDRRVAGTKRSLLIRLTGKSERGQTGTLTRLERAKRTESPANPCLSFCLPCLPFLAKKPDFSKYIVNNYNDVEFLRLL